MSSIEEDDEVVDKDVNNIHKSFKNEKSYRLTRHIITFSENELSSIDIKTFLEMGSKIFRFKMTHTKRTDKIHILEMIQDAIRWCCTKYEVSTWPITISIDIPNACIRTGFLKEEITGQIELKEDWIIEITSDIKFWNKCDSYRIFLDDHNVLKEINIGTEITTSFGKIVMVCTEKINNNTIKCKIMRGDILGSFEFVCIRGVKNRKPPLTKVDVDLIEFAKEYKLDMITVNSVRWGKTLKMIRKMFVGEAFTPLIMSSICEQEGLDNIDDIIENSDCILLAREFLAHSIEDPHKMITIQLQVGAKCRRLGKPFFISGNVLEPMLHKGIITGCDLTDITNAVMQGAGFLLRNYKDPSNVLKAITLLNETSIMVESIEDRELWRMTDEFPLPVNAAEACVLASAVTAQQSNSMAFVVLTVTGKTAVQLSHAAPSSVILSVSTNPVVARKLHVYRGIVPIVYDKPPLQDYHAEMNERVKFAVAHGLKSNILSYGQNYVVLKKCWQNSSYCDSVSVWKVVIEESFKKHKYNESVNSISYADDMELLSLGEMLRVCEAYAATHGLTYNMEKAEYKSLRPPVLTTTFVFRKIFREGNIC